MAKKYYAVKVGETPGIYTSWDECKDQVHGYPGALYKSFTTIDEAEAYMGKAEKPIAKRDELSSTSEHIAYVDGSFEADSEYFSWGLVLINGDNIEKFSGYHKNQDSAHRNVAGEIYGSVNAVKLSLERGYKDLDLHYDYSGIRHWALGEWKRNNPLTKRYFDFMQDSLKKIDINFYKVKAHSGEKYNELADELAKKALKEKEV